MGTVPCIAGFIVLIVPTMQCSSCWGAFSG
jgi:hypothetical protein